MSYNKQIFKISTLKKLLNEENSCVSLVPATRILALPPFFLNDMKSGILYLLNNSLKKYDRSLGGIIIGYQNIKVLMDENTGFIPIGTAETEVNISVEFYIFQPKIGSLLRGVINKISNSHIGCLIHRYFNATILKPDDVSYDDWISSDFEVNDEIILKVKDLDFTSLLPHIEGIIDESTCLKKGCRKNEADSDFKEENSNKELLDNEGEKTEQVDTLKDSVTKNLNSLDFSTEKFRKNKKKKKKKEKEKEVNSTESPNQAEQALGTNDKEATPDIVCKKSSSHETYYSKKEKKKDKKKKKDKEKEDVRNTQESLNVIENAVENSLKPSSLFESSELNEKNVTPSKKHKTEEEPESELNKTIEWFSSNEAEDNVFYSTEIHPSLPKKWKILCSPIPTNSPFVEKTNSRQSEIVNKEKKQKNKKRKREEVEEKESDSVSSTSKKIKISEAESTKVNDSKNSLLQNMMEELQKKQLDRIKEELNIPNKEQKMKKNKNKNEEKSTEETKSKQDILDEIRKHEIQRIKDELNISDKETNKSCKKLKKKKTNEESTNPQVNITVSEKKLSVEEMMDKLIKEQMERTNNKPDVKKEKKVKSKLNKSTNSIYDNLLKEARSSVDSDGSKSIPKESKKKKKNDLRITSNQKSPEKLKNGDMNYKDFTPEKVSFDKSLFSDSEQSNLSPVKVQKKLKETEVDSDASKKDKKSVKSDKKKSKKSNKSEAVDVESLYEKLLRDAKSLILRGKEEA